MTPVNGIGSNGKVHFKGPLGAASPVQLARTLGLRATPAARERLLSYLQSGKNPAHLLTLFGRTCSALHLESGKFTEEIFVERFSQWQVEGLDRDPDPDSPSYHTRFLLRKFTNCDLAYHEGSGLAMVTSEERGDIAKGDAEGYQLACPFAAKLQIIAPPISSPLPRVNLARRVVALVKRMAQPLAEKRSYSEQLTERILFHVTEGHSRSAAFLLFRDKTAREILDFVREENLAKKISSPEWAALLRIGMRPDIDYSVPSEEIAIGYLLAEAHPVISAYFIEDLAKSDPHSAARILGLVGQTTRSVEVAEAGDLISDVERSLAGYVLSAMLIRGQEKLANRVVAQGMREAIFRGTYERVLAEMNVDFDENIATADKYDGSSLFRAGSVFFREVGGEGSTAIIKVKDGPYGWGGEELLSPRLFYRNLARKLIEGEGYDLAWEMMTCGRPAVEAFNDLNSVLDPASFGRLLRTRGRDEIARFVVEILAGGEEYIEALAYVLRDTHEDIRDVAGLFEYLIEADGEIAGSREAAYAILYYAATAIENPSMAPLLDRYQEILVQIEQDKEGAGWFNADVFLKEGRFLPTDPPSKAREERLKFDFDLLRNAARPEEERIYAVRMMGRMGAIEYLDPLRKMIAVELKVKRYNKLLMNMAVTLLDICENLDMNNPNHRTAQKKTARFLKGTRDYMVDAFMAKVEDAGKIIEGWERGKTEKTRIKMLEKARLGRAQEIKEIINRSLSRTKDIKDDWDKEKAMKNLLEIVLVVGLTKTEAVEILMKALIIAEGIEASGRRACALEQVALAMTKCKLFAQALFIAERIRCDLFYEEGAKTIIVAVLSAELPKAEIEDILINASSIAKKMDGGHTTRNETLRRIAVAMIKMGLFYRALAAVELINKTHEKALTLKDIAVTMAEMGVSKDKTEEILTKALDFAQESYDYLKAKTITEVAMAMHKTGFAIEKVASALLLALSLVNRNMDVQHKVAVYKSIAVAMAEVGLPRAEIEGVLKWAIFLFKDTGEELVDIAMTMVQLGMPNNEVKDIINMALSNKNQYIYRDRYRYQVFPGRGFLALMAKAHLLSEALDYAKSFQERAGSWPLSDVACVMAEEQLFDQAIAVAEEIKDKDSRAFAITMREIAITMAKKRFFPQALALTSKDSFYTADIIAVLCKIAEAMAEDGAPKNEVAEVMRRALSFYKMGTFVYVGGAEFREIIKVIPELGLPQSENMASLNEILHLIKEGVERQERAPLIESLGPLMIQAGYFNRPVRIRRKSPKLIDLALRIYNYPTLASRNLSGDDKVIAWLHTRIYAVLGMAEE